MVVKKANKDSFTCSWNTIELAGILTAQHDSFVLLECSKSITSHDKIHIFIGFLFLVEKLAFLFNRFSGFGIRLNFFVISKLLEILHKQRKSY